MVAHPICATHLLYLCSRPPLQGILCDFVQPRHPISPSTYFQAIWCVEVSLLRYLFSSFPSKSIVSAGPTVSPPSSPLGPPFYLHSSNALMDLFFSLHLHQTTVTDSHSVPYKHHPLCSLHHRCEAVPLLWSESPPLSHPLPISQNLNDISLSDLADLFSSPSLLGCTPALIWIPTSESSPSYFPKS
jgi:hypothetical protein